MPQSISNDIIRTCKRCGQEFKPHARKQFYCGEVRQFKCIYCGNTFEAICNSQTKSTCSTECQAKYIKEKRTQSAAKLTRKCKWCRAEFTPTSARDAYCSNPHYQTCIICGKSFELDVRRDSTVKTCSKECKIKYALQQRDIPAESAKQQAVLLEKYGVDNAMKIPGSIEKMKQTNLHRYGHEWYTQTEEYKERVAETDLEKYGVDHHLKAQSVKDKRTKTVCKLYGTSNVFSSEYGKAQVKARMKELYGVENPSQYFEFKRKATANSRKSKLEIRIMDLFSNYDIEYKHHHFISNEGFSHEFDFYLPKYKTLIDADGLYFHSYLDDPDGYRVNDYYDEVRLKLVPSDHMFFLLIENSEDQQVKELAEILNKLDNNLFDYDSYLFNWCRSIDFPYPKYSDERMQKDYAHLCKYNNFKYDPRARLGSSAINQFHRSIFDAHVGSYPSPKEAWYDDKLLKKVITNRLIYKNDVDPYKIMKGFSISKICPRVSVFNPVLARYICQIYLSKYTTIFDPFSGYSGRLLGVCSTGKTYVGQDLNEIAVQESNQIIEFLNLQNSSVECRNILESEGEYEALLTCPPYYKKEHYNSETEFKTCDDWIDLILSRFKCHRYVFVVDETEKYKEHVVEDIKATSHLSKVLEKLIVIEA